MGEHVARRGRKEKHTEFWWGNLKVTSKKDDNIKTDLK
jgi:hypothetical protein